jgi:hypothetical protein
LNCVYGSWQDVGWGEIRTKEEEETKREHLRRLLALGPTRRYGGNSDDKRVGYGLEYPRAGCESRLALGDGIRDYLLHSDRLEFLEVGVSRSKDSRRSE